MVARLKSGRTIKRSQSDVDYGGGFKGFHVEFDAKQTKGVSISLDNFKPHQVTKLCSSERCGNLAGFMVYFSDSSRVFWVHAFLVRDAQDKAMFQKKGKAKFPKSLSLPWMVENAIEIPHRAGSMVVDWLPILMKVNN